MSILKILLLTAGAALCVAVIAFILFAEKLPWHMRDTLE